MAVRVDSLEIEIGYTANNAADQIEKLAQSLGELKNKLSSTNMQSLNKGFTELAASLKKISNRDVRKISELADALQKLSSVGSINIGRLSSTTKKAKESAKSASKISQILSKLKSNLSKATAGARSFIKAIGRIALYRLIRSAIKAITEAIQVGLSNAYQYSATVGFRLKDSLDSISSASMKMKNQIGSAAAEILSALAPALVKIANLVTRAADAIAQFIAALQGHKTYLKAKDITEPWEEGTEAAKEYKDNLQGFDDLNVITSPSSSGSGSSDYGSMFEETDISSSIMEKVQWLKDHFDQIKDVVIAIAAGLLAWKIASIFTSSVSKLLGIFMAIAGAVLLVMGYTDAWQNGLNQSNMTEIFAGMLLLVVGLGIAFGATVGAIALVVSGIAMLVLGLKEWITTGQLSDETFNMLEAGIAAVCIGLAFFFGWIPLVVGAVLMIALAVYKNWDKIKEKLSEAWETIKTFFGKVVDKVKELWEKIKNVLLKIKDKFVEFFTSAKEKFTNFVTFVKEKVIDKLLEKFTTFKDKVKTTFTNIIDSVTTAISDTFKKVMNTIFEKIEKLVNGFIGGINAVIDIINAIPGVNISTISEIELPRLAQGGVTTGQTTAVIGEAGREAVLPLDNNTGWMDVLAEKVSQNIVVSFQVEGDPNGLFRVTQNQARQYTRRTGQPAFN